MVKGNYTAAIILKDSDENIDLRFWIFILNIESCKVIISYRDIVLSP